MVQMSMGYVQTTLVVTYVLGVVERMRSNVMNGDDRRVSLVDKTCEHVDP